MARNSPVTGAQTYGCAQLEDASCKCDFLRHEASFLGHILRVDGILTQDSKLSVIKNWPPLTDIRSVRAFVSLCSYYRKFIWKFAEIAAPLTDLLKDGGWRPPTDAAVLDAVAKLKEALISSPVLAYFDVNAVATDLYCDASGGSIGAVLQQTDKDGVIRPVGFYSRKINTCRGTLQHLRQRVGWSQG
jgi:hypothetical protein